MKTLTAMVYFPPEKQEQKPVCLFEFRVDPLNWQSFIEIGEMAGSTTAWCSREYTLKSLVLGNPVDQNRWHPLK